VFAATALRCGARTAVDAADAVLSYDQLAEAAEELAARLTEIGVGPGDRVGVRIPSGTAELYVAILAVLTSGAAYVPVDFDDPPARAAMIWERSGAAAVVERGLQLREVAQPHGAGRALTPQDDAWVIFTSGSTGEPKGVAVSHRAAAAFVDAEAQLWSIGVDDRVLAGLSVSFDASCEEIWLAWRHGAALVPAPREIVRSGAELGPWLAGRGVTVISTVPTLAAMWDDAALAGVRLLILGGEACPEPLAWRLAREREVWNTYGPTEATVVSTAARLRAGEPVTIGWPLAGWQVAVVDEDGEPVAVGEPGELVIGGVGLGRYLDATLDSERFAPLPPLGWDRAYRSGDVVRETIGGLEFVGRRDDQVKIGGRRIELGEVDALLCGVPGVKAALSAVRESAAQNKLLVGYVVGDVEEADVRAAVSERLPSGIAPLIVVLDALPRGASGKVDRKALPWPPPARQPATASIALGETAAWLAERWEEQLGPLAVNGDSDFFELGGSSLAAAKLVSQLRKRFPAAAVADVYNHRRLGELAARLEGLGEAAPHSVNVQPPPARRWGVVQMVGVLALLLISAPQWLLGILAVDHWHAGQIGPEIGWPLLALGWLAFASAPGRAMFVLVVRRLLLSDLQPGRYPRQGWLTCKLWFVERLSEVCRLESLAGTPWALRYARISGHEVGDGARLGTLPPAASLVSIGAGATLEPDVDVHGWWIEGSELVIGELRIGARARVGTRVLLMPGAEIGDGAEVEPGSVVTGPVPAGERWAGCPAARVGMAGELWPATAPPARRRRRRSIKALYALGLSLQNLLPLAAAIPGLIVLMALAPATWTPSTAVRTMVLAAPLLAACFLACYALLVALVVRAVALLIKPGWHGDDGTVGWALWLTEATMGATHDMLFPLYSSVYTRGWLRALGVRVGRRTEVSTAVGMNRLTSLGEKSFAADDVVLACGRARDGWLCVEPIEIGGGSFLGNGAILPGGARVGRSTLIGLLTTAPSATGDGTSWLGSPALELPRRPEMSDPARTTDPPLRLVLARGAVELVRFMLPATVSVMLAALVFSSLDAIGVGAGVWAMAAAAPFITAGAGLMAVLITVAVKWTVIGRYRAGEHPLWSFYVWRDEIINTCQEQLAGAWLLRSALATPLLSVYLRLMGAEVGRGVWCETLTVTEHDLARLGDGCAVNRNAVVETHLFHDRLMRTGPCTLGAGSTIGPSTAMLPDTTIGAGCTVGGRSIVMRGESLPAHTRWHGAPVVAVAG
jgi:non-ribosomal peptide synthetase-like protein